MRVKQVFSISEETARDVFERAEEARQRTGATGFLFKRTASTGGRWEARGVRREQDDARAD